MTLIELLVAILAGLLVIVIPLTWIIVSLRQQNNATSRAVSVTQTETGLAQLTRDLREAAPGATMTFTWGATSASATFSIPTSGTQGAQTQAVTWSCTFGNAGNCTRQVDSGAQKQEISNVESLGFAPQDANGNAMTSPAQNPAYVGITVTVQDTSSLDRTNSSPVYSGAKPITLTDGVQLRNSTP